MIKPDDRIQELLAKKRDGRTVPFDHQKLYRSLERSNQELTAPLRSAELKQLLQVQQEELLAAYRRYARQKEQERLAALDINQAVQQLLDKDSRLVHENANKDAEVFNTQRDLTAGIVGKAIGLKLLPSHVANAHQKRGHPFS